jgi:hypothetical protein
MFDREDINGCSIYNYIFLTGNYQIFKLIVAEHAKCKEKGEYKIMDIYNKGCNIPDIPIIENENLQLPKDMIFWNIRHQNYDAIKPRFTSKKIDTILKNN